MYKKKIHEIIEFQHVKPGKGPAFVRTKLKNLETGTIYENTFRTSEKVEKVFVDKKNMQYLYKQHDSMIMMDLETYEQIPVHKSNFGDKKEFLKEGCEVSVVSAKGKVLDVQLPHIMELEVVECSPGVLGDTAQGGTKPATLESGAVVKVPLFVNKNDTVRVDTRTGEYLERCD